LGESHKISGGPEGLEGVGVSRTREMRGGGQSDRAGDS